MIPLFWMEFYMKNMEFIMKVLLVQVPTSHLGAGEKVYPLGLSRLSSTVPDTVEKKCWI